MRTLIALIIFVFLFISCETNSSNSPTKDKIPSSTSEKWYKGGTLHKAKINEWKAATDKNKLATCGDFMATVDNSISMDVLKQRAEDLKNCINEATIGLESTNNESVVTVAALCIKQMRY